MITDDRPVIVVTGKQYREMEELGLLGSDYQWVVQDEVLKFEDEDEAA